MSAQRNSLVLALVFLLLPAFASEQTQPTTAFDQLKSLTGELPTTAAPATSPLWKLLLLPDQQTSSHSPSSALRR